MQLMIDLPDADVDDDLRDGLLYQKDLQSEVIKVDQRGKSTRHIHIRKN